MIVCAKFRLAKQDLFSYVLSISAAIRLTKPPSPTDFFFGYSLRPLIVIKNSALVPETRQQQQQSPFVYTAHSLSHSHTHTNSYRIWINPPNWANPYLWESPSVLQTGPASPSIVYCLVCIQRDVWAIIDGRSYIVSRFWDLHELYHHHHACKKPKLTCVSLDYLQLCF